MTGAGTSLPRKEVVKKYLDKYSLGVMETENSLGLYNDFFRNMGFKERIEGLIEKKLGEKVFVRVLDIGCGNAGFLSDLKKKFGESVHTIGIDLLAPGKKPDEMIAGDALEAQFPEEVDFVFSFRSLHEVGEPEKIVQKVHSSLAEGGKAFLSFRTMDLLLGKTGLGQLREREVKALSKMVNEGKLSGFEVRGFEVSVKDQEGHDKVAGINVFLEK